LQLTKISQPFRISICISTIIPSLIFHGTMLLGLPIRDCAIGCSNRAQLCPQLSAIDVTAKTFFERLYLDLGLCEIVTWVNCPLCTHNSDHSHYNYFSISLQFFPRMAPHFFFHHDSPSNLAESQYPPRNGLYWTISKMIFWNLFTCKGTWLRTGFFGEYSNLKYYRILHAKHTVGWTKYRGNSRNLQVVWRKVWEEREQVGHGASEVGNGCWNPRTL